MSRQQSVLFTLTRIAAAAVAANRFITFTGAQNTSAGAKCLGVSDMPAAAGEAFPVKVHGTSMIEAGGAIGAGVAIKSDANGKAVAQGGTGEILGYSLEAASGDGAIFEGILAL